jgi:hypothetical protein
LKLPGFTTATGTGSGIGSTFLAGGADGLRKPKNPPLGAAGAALIIYFQLLSSKHTYVGVLISCAYTFRYMHICF